ncbi:SET and MYND domain-containing protein 4 [Mugil cephalus]|uniref:SET and MYND domain-containing protein 4 n=1 Tax=Mugil cephalus TaxID=48193 RepID=UPI001FB7BC30|nr:SET and MYND domain-containing protein 4 [Mugil cephalus]
MMDFPCVQWQDHVAQKWAALDPELKDKFSSLLEIDDVFKCALSLTTQDDVDFVESVSAGHSVQKDTEEAARCRERGNSSFKTRNYTAAALHYSQGVCFAPQSSEQLSLCFANRSAALYHLQRYQECLDDIDSALKSGYPSHLSHKLQDRRALCLKHVFVKEKEQEEDHGPASQDQKGRGRVKAPSVGPFMFGICPQAAVGSSVEKGRHLVAAERIAAGDVILTDRPYSCVLIPGVEEVRVKGRRRDKEEEEFGTERRRCHWCLAETLRAVPCDGCSYGRYCSNGCRREAWEDHHRWECPLGADLTVMGVMSQLALRVTLKAGLRNVQMAKEPIGDKHRKPEPSCDSSDSHPRHSNLPSTSYYGDSYLSVFHLLHHINRQSLALRFLCAVTVATLYLRLSEAGPPPASWSMSRPSAATGQSQDGPNEEEGDGADWSSELWLLGSAVLRHMLQLRCNAQAIVTLQDAGAANSPVQSSREVRIATAIFPTLSLLNHSCRPNTSLAFSTGAHTEPRPSDPSAGLSEREAERKHGAPGVTVTVRAARVIGPGQEILHCYGPHSSRMATQERQRLLHEQYYFLCQCEACVHQQDEVKGEGEGTERQPGPGDTRLRCCQCKGPLEKSSENGETGFVCPPCGRRTSSSELSRRLQEIRVDLETAVELMERGRPDEALNLLQRTQCQSRLILTETHPLQGELADATARAYATMGDWTNAASHLERSAAAVGSQYGEDSIELGRQLFKLTQLHFNGGARGAALAVLPKVRRLLRLHCGPGCHELQELEAMEDCLRG